MSNSRDDLKLMIFYPPILHHCEPYSRLYEFWRDSWRAANTEIDVPTDFPSDGLTRQHETLALFHGDRPVSAVCHRYVDLACASTYDDSFFQHGWTENDVAQLRGHTGLGVFGSQIVIDPAYRKLRNDVGMKQLISFLSLTQCASREPDVILGRMRSDRGVSKVFTGTGIVVLRKDVAYHNILLDLVAFFPKIQPVRIPAEYHLEIERLLSEAEHVRSDLAPQKIAHSVDPRRKAA